MTTSQIETLFAKTDGTSLTGTFALLSELMEAKSTVALSQSTTITIPKGLRAKVWVRKLDGGPCVVTLNINANPTGVANSGSLNAPTNLAVPLDQTALITVATDTRRPIVIQARDHLTAVMNLSFAWSQTVAATTALMVIIEWELIIEDSLNYAW